MSALTADLDFQLQFYRGPTLLYKYREATHPHAEKYLREGTLGTPNAIAFNDPFDSKPHRLRSNADGEELQQLIQQVQKTRFLCFSGGVTGDQKDILRWSHYGEGHRGFCLIISDSWLAENAKPVSYEANYPDLTDIVASAEDFWPKIGFFKAPIWSYEDEKRVILPNHGQEFYALPQGAIWGIIFGCWSRREERKRIMAALFEHSPRCKVFDAHIERDSYQIRYRFINLDGDVRWARSQYENSSTGENTVSISQAIDTQLTN